MRASSLLAAAALAAAALAGCSRQHSAPEGALLQVDTLASAAGLELFQPVAAARGADGAVYVLDAGNSALYRLRPGGGMDTVARAGRGPGQLRNPAAFGWRGDTLVVVDRGNARVQLLDARGRAYRTVRLDRAGEQMALDPARGVMYLTVYGQSFSIVSGKPQVTDDSLVSVVSLADGREVGRFGTPLRYEGSTLSIFGNYVRLARNPSNGEIALAWLIEPRFGRYGPDGRWRGTLRRPLAFDPPKPREVTDSHQPLPIADAQRVNEAIAFRPDGALLVLTPIRAKKGLASARDFHSPPQAVDVVDAAGAVRCRVRLPFTATALSADGPDALLLADRTTTPDVYRVRYRCPR